LWANKVWEEKSELTLPVQGTQKSWILDTLNRTYLAIWAGDSLAVVEWVSSQSRLKLLASITVTSAVQNVLSEGSNLVIGLKNELKVLSLETLELISSVQLAGHVVGMGTIDPSASGTKVLGLNSKEGGVLYWLNGLTVTHQLTVPAKIYNLLTTQNG
jgi:hypothetical protein